MLEDGAGSPHRVQEAALRRPESLLHVLLKGSKSTPLRDLLCPPALAYRLMAQRPFRPHFSTEP